MLNLANLGRPSCSIVRGIRAATGSVLDVATDGDGGVRWVRLTVGRREAGWFAARGDAAHDVIDTAAVASRAITGGAFRTTSPPYGTHRVSDTSFRSNYLAFPTNLL